MCSSHCVTSTADTRRTWRVFGSWPTTRGSSPPAGSTPACCSGPWTRPHHHTLSTTLDWPNSSAHPELSHCWGSFHYVIINNKYYMPNWQLNIQFPRNIYFFWVQVFSYAKSTRDTLWWPIFRKSWTDRCERSTARGLCLIIHVQVVKSPMSLVQVLYIAIDYKRRRIERNILPLYATFSVTKTRTEASILLAFLHTFSDASLFRLSTYFYSQNKWEVIWKMLYWTWYLEISDLSDKIVGT